MARRALATDADLRRARDDPAFRHRMVQDHLELLLAALNRLRGAGIDRGGDVESGEQIREGVTLAVRLADILHKIAETGSKPR